MCLEGGSLLGVFLFEGKLLSAAKPTKGISGLNELSLGDALALMFFFLCQSGLNLFTDGNGDNIIH